MPKQTGKNSEFAALADRGIRAYQHAKDLNLLGMAEQHIATEIGVGEGTVNGWRRGRTTRRYDDLTRFAAVCLKAAPELGEQWVTDLFRAGDMAGYRDQALAEIRNSQVRGTRITSERTSDADHTVNVAGSVPVLPNYYVRRKAKLDALKALTLAQRETGGWIAVLGMTGTGKSTLMAALGHDPEINTEFAGNVRWFEIRQTTTTLRLVQRIATAFGKELSEEYASDSDAITALRRVLPDEPFLLLLDNIVNPTDVSLLQALGQGVVIVVTVRTMQDVALLHIPEKAWVMVRELTADEAWALVQQVTPVPEDQIPAAKAVLQAVEYHPYTTVVVASAALTLNMKWDEIQKALQTIAVRLGVIQFLQTRNRNVWAPLELDWERLDAQGQYALTTLGRLPYFLQYDLPLAQAVWGLSAAEALRVWKGLAAMQLARPVPDVPGVYTVHWLIRDFAADKAQQWSLWQRLRFAGWVWRYRLPFRLRWWWPALRKPQPDSRWPWYSFTLPGTEGRRGMRFIDSWMINTLWQQDGRQLNLRAGPVEWVAVKRLSVRFLAAILAFICLAVAAALTLSQGNRPFVAALGMVVALWVTIVTYIDTRRAAMWWGLDTSSPYTAAFTEKDQEKDPP